MRSRTPNWSSTLRKNSELMKSRTQMGACCTISVTCSTMVGIRVAKKPTTAMIRTDTDTRMPAGRGILPALQPPHHRVQAQGNEKRRHDPEQKLGGVGADPVDQEGQAHAHGAHEADVERDAAGRCGARGGRTGGVVCSGRRALLPCGLYSGGISKRSRGWAPGQRLAQALRSTATSAAAAAPGLLGTGAALRGGGLLGSAGGGRFSWPCVDGFFRLVSHCFLVPVPCVAPRLRAGVMIIANTISSLVNSREGRPVQGRPAGASCRTPN